MTKTLLSLFDYSGIWSQPYRDNGWRVIQVDIQHGLDVLAIDSGWLDDLGPVAGILAAPPCTHFSGSGARWWADKDRLGMTQQAICLVEKTLQIIEYLSPAFWALENPVGRIGRLVAGLSLKPAMYFNPCDYAQLADDPASEQYTKRTGLWGVFNAPARAPLPPVLGSKMHRLPPSPDRARLRSVTPSGFARAFYTANNETTKIQRQLSLIA